MPRPQDNGFTTVELMIVVLIIGVLVAIAIPVYVMATSQSSMRTCFANQRTLEGAGSTWMALSDGAIDELAGAINRSHPVVVDHIIGSVPRCPSGAEAADRDNPTQDEGGYVFDSAGVLKDCPHGRLGPHGHY